MVRAFITTFIAYSQFILESKKSPVSSLKETNKDNCSDEDSKSEYPTKEESFVDKLKDENQVIKKNLEKKRQEKLEGNFVNLQIMIITNI